MNKEFPCKCGHIAEKHQQGSCLMCKLFKTWQEAEHKFKLDNLKYLEHMYEKTLEKVTV